MIQKKEYIKYRIERAKESIDKGDYEVYQTFSKDDVEPYIDETELFIKSAETLLENEL